MHIITPYLKTLFNEILDTSNFPEDWGKSLIVPIHKKGPMFDPNNFRGISLMDSLCKIFMNILSIRLTKWSDEFNVIDEAQAGFRKTYSTIDNCFTLMAVTQKYISKKKGRFHCIFVDFAKAFDSIDHDKLWESFNRKNVNGKFLNILKSAYSKLKSCVKMDDKLSQFFECTVGARQGCVASPIIFSLFINDLVDYLQVHCGNGIYVSQEADSLISLLFADDVAGFSDTVRRLQRIIDTIANFCDLFGMKINLGKTKIIVFRNGGFLKDIEKWFYKGDPIEVVSFYKYLGLYFTPKLVWSKTKDMLSKQALKAISNIYRYQRNFGRFNPKDMFKLFDTMVKPILCYGSEIWGFTYSEVIEKTHIRFCKRYCSLSPNVADFFALGECGRLPLCTTYMSNCIKYWLRLLRMQESRYPKQCYFMLKRLDEVGRKTWASSVRELLFSYGFGYVWITHEVGDENNFLLQFKQRVIDGCLQKWRSDVDNSSKAEHYKCFKSVLDVESYISFDIPYELRAILANFRCSGHKLMIEKGRHDDIDAQFRFCPICITDNIHIMEDEYHFFFECTVYEHIRDMFFKRTWLRYRSLNMFYTIMGLRDRNSVLKIASFLKQAFTLRTTLLNNQ